LLDAPRGLDDADVKQVYEEEAFEEEDFEGRGS
jgi:hypothetical protein